MVQKINIKVSVIMSVYNSSKYLKEAIESILNQTFKNFEFLIIDDNSTDDSCLILREYAKKDNRIRLFCNVKNQGLTKNLQKLLKIAKGKYIARQDSDDVSFKNRLTSQVSYLDAHPEIILVGTRFIYLDKFGKEYNYVPSRNLTIQKIKNMIKKRNFFPHGSIMFRKKEILSIGGYNTDFKYSQDTEIYQRVIKKYNIGYLDQILYGWRILFNNISTKKSLEQKMYEKLARTRREKIKKKQDVLKFIKNTAKKDYVNSLFYITFNMILFGNVKKARHIIVVSKIYSLKLYLLYFLSFFKSLLVCLFKIRNKYLLI